MSKVTDLASAIGTHIDPGTEVYLGGFTHLIPFAAGHEIIRQEIGGLRVIRTTPDLVVDRLVAAGLVDSVCFSYAGNPGVGSLRAFRRAVESRVPRSIGIEEYSHLALVTRLDAGARGLPFLPVRTALGTDLPAVNEAFQTVENPYDTGPDVVAVVPPMNPEVAIVRAQRADAEGNAHLWGIHGEIVEAVFAAETVILSVEELVDGAVIRSDPNRTVIPGPEVDAVVEVPYGSHPSYAHGYYNRDNEAYLAWDVVTQTHEGTLQWLEEYVHSIDDHAGYLELVGDDRFDGLSVADAPTEPANMGRYG